MGGRSKNILAFVHERAEALRATPYADLATLPERTTLETPGAFPRWQFFLWREDLPDGALRIRVEGFRTYWLGLIMRSVNDGFEISPTGRVSDLPKDDPR
ncbi:MAG: hypothetical protein ACREI3_11130 [Nitrospirales bacterium]